LIGHWSLGGPESTGMRYLLFISHPLIINRMEVGILLVHSKQKTVFIGQQVSRSKNVKTNSTVQKYRPSFHVILHTVKMASGQKRGTFIYGNGNCNSLRYIRYII